MSESFDRELNALIDRFHAQEGLRVWSLVITVFGDAVLPRGGEIWLGSLQELLQRLHVEPSALRAAMSRLTADGWLCRIKAGRKSFYRLAAAGEAEFAAGTAKIYTPPTLSDAEDWTIVVLIGEAGSKRDARKAALRTAGFGSLSPTVFVRPGRSAPQEGFGVAGELVFVSRLCGGDAPSMLVANAWPMDEIESGYDRLINLFTPIETALTAGARPGALSAMAARSLLIHAFRRTTLRDPHFPPHLRPVNWKGDTARRLVASVYRQLASPSESWLDTCPVSDDQTMPRPKINMAKRFGMRDATMDMLQNRD